MNKILAVFLVTLAWSCSMVYAQTSQPAKPATGLTAALIATQDTYTLDAAQAGKAFREKLAEAEKGLKRLRAPAPKVDLVLRVSNPTKEAVTFAVGGDESTIDLQLEGPGAVTVNNNVAMTMEFREGKEVTLAPGKTHDIAIKSLSFGTRNIARSAYWTEVGEYTLSATLNTRQGETPMKVTSEAVKLKVVKAGER